MNLIRRARIGFAAALLGCSCAAMLALGPGGGKSDGKRAGAAGSGTILYVDDDAPPGGDGLTWPTAHRFLQDALDAAREPESGVTEIRVAGGEYKPDQGASVTPGDVNESFEMVSGIALRGGYRGAYELDAGAFDPTSAGPNERDFERFESIISGDLLDDDGQPGSFQNYDDNSFHLMRVADPAPGTIIEGFTFTASNREQDSSQGSAYGGGIRSIGGTLTVTQCEFKYNLAFYAGGLYSEDTDLTLTHSLFQNNFARAISASGGGAMIEGGDIVIEDCDFIGNGCEFGDTGGLSVVADSSRAERCNFFYNASGDRGGGAGFNANSTLIDCRFVGNSTAIDGGALVGGIVLINCEFLGNYAGQFGGAVHTINSIMTRCTFEGNNTGFEGGGGYAGSGSFVNCRFLRNGSAKGFTNEGGAAAWLRYPGGGTFTNCVFAGNESDGAGGAVYVNPSLSASFTNCVFTNNDTGFGQAGAIAGQGAITNSILWNNTPAQLAGSFATSFSCVAVGWPGEGNISGDPLFVDSLGRDGIAGTLDDDLRLLAGSPCIDSGSNLVLPADVHDLDVDGDVTEPLPIDLSGGQRVVNDPITRNSGAPPTAGAIVDMGALEFRDFPPLIGDADGNGLVSIDDLLMVIGAWGACPAMPSSCDADLTGDAHVSIDDLLLVVMNWSV